MEEVGDNISVYTPQDKLQREVEKLTEEVRVLKHPFSQPASWIASIALVLSIAGNIGQSLTYESRATIAKADVAQAKLDKMDVEAKRDNAKTELEGLQNQLTSIKGEIDNARKGTNSSEVKTVLDNVEQKVNTLQESTQKAADNLVAGDSQSTTSKIKDNDQGNRLQIAKNSEKEGFENLVKGDYEGAQRSFENVEKTYPSYHNAYELAKILRENKSQMNDPAKKKEVLRTIVKQFSYGAPPDLWKQVVENANQ